MKKVIALMLAALMLTSVFALTSCGNDNTLTVYTEAGFAPYEFMYENKIVGVDIAIMEKVAEKLGKELVVKDVDFNGIVAAVKSGKADVGAAGITINDERKESVDFSVPYSSTEQYVVFQAENTEISTVETLKGKQIGVQNGTTSDLMIQALIADGTLEGTVLTGYNAPALAAAALGKIDAVVTDKLTAQIIAQNNSGLTAIPLVKEDGAPAAEVEEYGICVQKGNTELLTAINEVLTELLADGTIDKWVNEYTELAKTVEE